MNINNDYNEAVNALQKLCDLQSMPETLREGYTMEIKKVLNKYIQNLSRQQVYINSRSVHRYSICDTSGKPVRIHQDTKGAWVSWICFKSLLSISMRHVAKIDDLKDKLHSALTTARDMSKRNAIQHWRPSDAVK